MAAGWLTRRQCCHGDRLHGELGQVMMVEKVWSDLGSNEEVNQQDLMVDSIDHGSLGFPACSVVKTRMLVTKIETLEIDLA